MSNITDAMHRFMSCVREDQRALPPFSMLYAAYKADASSKHLRLGQWFYNRFMGSTFAELRELTDKLHAEQDYKKALDMIEGLYKDYQWPM